MSKETTYSAETITRICDEIERQWEYHLVTRAVFPVNAATAASEFTSPRFYQHYGAFFRVIVKDPASPLIRRALRGLPHWLNQNFIIRLFGLLDEYNVITAGKLEKNAFTGIIAGLRHLVGAHSSGYPSPQKREFKQVTRLIKAHLDPDVDVDSVRDFHLDIKKVLRPLKEKCLEFVRALEGKPRPEKKPTAERTGDGNEPAPC